MAEPHTGQLPGLVLTFQHLPQALPSLCHCSLNSGFLAWRAFQVSVASTCNCRGIKPLGCGVLLVWPVLSFVNRHLSCFGNVLVKTVSSHSCYIVPSERDIDPGSFQ